MSREIAGTPNSGTPSHPYYSHTTPIRIPWFVWELHVVPLMGSILYIKYVIYLLKPA